MSKIKNSGLDQYSAEPFEIQQLGTAGVEEVKTKNATKITLIRRTRTITKLEKVAIVTMYCHLRPPNAIAFPS